MKVIALTGGMASGKSTVAKMFEALGAQIIDADRVVHTIYETDLELKKKVVSHFGTSILNSKQEIDRKKLGGLVFQNRDKRVWLEALIHPAVRKQIAEQIEKAKKQSIPLVIVEAALMVEAAYYKQFEGLILVRAKPELQKQRAKLRDQLSDEEIEKRLTAQTLDEKKAKVSNWIIENSGDLKATQKQVKSLFPVLCSLT
ncbi:MAG: dephospho-CoA kinase [Deltaproteobacteria bacterium]|nr:dephospho-CoA kinase [Deltaproteobacteria bacterium]